MMLVPTLTWDHVRWPGGEHTSTCAPGTTTSLTGVRREKWLSDQPALLPNVLDGTEELWAWEGVCVSVCVWVSVWMCVWVSECECVCECVCVCVNVWVCGLVLGTLAVSTKSKFPVGPTVTAVGGTACEPLWGSLLTLWFMHKTSKQFGFLHTSVFALCVKCMILYHVTL